MSTGLSVYSSESVNGLNVIGTAIAKAGVVRGCDTAEKGMMFAMAAASRGVDVLSLAQRYELVNGQLSMPAKVQLAEFRRRGGRHKVIERTPDAAEIELTLDGKSQLFRLTWEEMRKECTPYNGKESETLRMIAADNQKALGERLKPKYATPRARMQMLWARLVSDSVGCTMPEVTDGIYTPEETEDFTDDVPVSRPSQTIAVAAPVEDAEFTTAATPAIAQKTVAGPGVELASGAQIERMNELFKLLDQSPEQQLNAFQKTGAYDLGSVTAGGADFIIKRMEGVLRHSAGQVEATAGVEAIAADAPTPPALPESAASTDDGSEPTTPEQIETIKRLLAKAVQIEGQANIMERISAHLQKSGMAKISQMSGPSTQRLIESLNGTSELDSFFDVTPKLHVTGE
jgi:hypothetical protein